MTDPDDALDLVFSRDVDLPPAALWRGWTTPALLVRWFTPAPWTTVACDIDLRPGGLFGSTMRSPEGQDFPNRGCYLDVQPGRRLVWTNAMAPGWRPVPPPTDSTVGFLFTVSVDFEPLGSGTRYTARAMHADAAGRERHAAMGFQAGWGAALDQLVALMRNPA